MFALPPSIPELISTLGMRIRRARLTRDWTQQDVARRAGVSLQTISRIEAGEGCTLENLLRVAQALGMLREFEGLFEIRPTSIAEMEQQAKIRSRAALGRRRASSRQAKDQP